MGKRISLSPILYALCPLLFITACGFRPVYGTQYQQERAVGSTALAAIAVETDTRRLSQLFKAELADRLNPTAAAVAKQYRLTVALAELNIPLFVASDGTYGRGNIQYTLNYSLIRIADGVVIDSGALTRVSSYAASETNAIYASYVAQEDAKKRGVIELASDLAMRMGNALDSDVVEGAAE